MIRPNKHLVIARETLPAHYRPSNQVRLVPAHSANPAASDPQTMLPGLGEVRMGNGMHSNGILSGKAEGRFARNIVEIRKKQAERQHQVQSSGSPNGRSRPMINVPLATAMQSLPSAPIQAMEPATKWEHIDTLQRPDGTRWVITKSVTPIGSRVAVALYRSRGDSDDEVVRSDNLAGESDAREYIRAYETQLGDFAGVGRPRRTSYWNGILRRGKDSGAAGASDARARTSRQDFSVINAKPASGGWSRLQRRRAADAGVVDAPRPPPVMVRKGHAGLDGVHGAALPAWAIALGAIGVVVLLTKNRVPASGPKYRNA